MVFIGIHNIWVATALPSGRNLFLLHEYIDKFWGWIGEACELLGFCFSSWGMQTERRNEFLRIMKGIWKRLGGLKKKGCWQGVISIRGD